MVIAFQVVLLIIIVISFLNMIAEHDNGKTATNLGLLSTIGIVSYIVTLLVF